MLCHSVDVTSISKRISAWASAKNAAHSLWQENKIQVFLPVSPSETLRSRYVN